MNVVEYLTAEKPLISLSYKGKVIILNILSSQPVFVWPERF